MNVSLRTKGILALVILVLYVAATSVFLANQRQKLLQIVREMETNQSNQAQLAPILSLLAHSIAETQAILNFTEHSVDRPLSYTDLADHFETISNGLAEAQHNYLMLAQDVAIFKESAASMRAFPGSLDLMLARDRQQKLIVRLHDILAGLQNRNSDLNRQYHDQQQYIAAFSIAANVIGALACAAVILIFFTRLARDIKRLQDRAVAIVDGYAGEPLPNSRNDEVGGLIAAVNRMQVDLRHSEQQVEVARQQRFHHEKMAAVGSLALVIGHEVGNPIAAISGVAQFIIDETRSDDRPSGKTVNEFASQILQQTERITRIMRQMATLTAPRSPDAELLDLNVLIKSTCDFIRYDTRLRGIEVELDLDQDIPAVTAVADHITQILMNLLINAADAMDHMTEPGRRRLRISTRRVADGVHISVSDNGCGMTPEVLAKAFEKSFTTKPVGKGRGVGLFVCKTLIEEAGGRIALDSKPGEGTTANLYFPLRPPDRAPG
jgi:signal transduction histidine kinase